MMWQAVSVLMVISFAFHHIRISETITQGARQCNLIITRVETLTRRARRSTICIGLASIAALLTMAARGSCQAGWAVSTRLLLLNKGAPSLRYSWNTVGKEVGSSTMTAQIYLLHCRVRSADIPDIASTQQPMDGRCILASPWLTTIIICRLAAVRGHEISRDSAHHRIAI